MLYSFVHAQHLSTVVTGLGSSFGQAPHATASHHSFAPHTAQGAAADGEGHRTSTHMKRSGDAEPSSLERKPLLQQSSSGHINRSAWQPSEVAIDIAPRPLSPHTRGGDHAPGGSISSTGSSSLKGTAVAPGQPSSWEPRQCRICFGERCFCGVS